MGKGASPNAAKGVQFDNVTVENREEGEIGRNNRNNSQSTDPLVTDSFSGESEEFFQKNEEEMMGSNSLVKSNLGL